MDIATITALMAQLEHSSLTYLEYAAGNERIVLKKELAGSHAEPMITPEEAKPVSGGHDDEVVVTAPLVGTVYRAQEPGAEPYTALGETVAAGDVLCLIEAMKMFNEIKAPVDGIIREIHFADGDLAEFGAPLFTIGKTS